MEVINIFMNQSKTGIIICYIIMAIFFMHVIMSIKTLNFYRRLNLEIEDKKRSKLYKFKNKVVLNTYKEFRKAMKSGIDSINTQVIILENIPKRQKLREELLNFFVSSVIILGLLGTFIGLTGAIMNVKDILGSLYGKANNIDVFMKSMGAPLESMSTAFITSIFGIVSAIILRIIGLITYKNRRKKFYDSMENYLDNYEAANNSRNYFRLLTEFTTNVESSMEKMTERVSTIFDKGIMEITNKINFASVDLSETAKSLDDTVGKLNMSITTFNRPIFEFKRSVDNFKSYYNGFNNGIEKIDAILGLLSRSINGAVKSFDKNKDVVKEVSAQLYKSSKNISKSYDKLMGMVDIVEEMCSTNNVSMDKKIKDTEKVNKELLKSIVNFEASVKSITKTASNVLKDNFKGEITNINGELEKSISKPLQDIKLINKSMETQLYLLGKNLNENDRKSKNIIDRS